MFRDNTEEWSQALLFRDDIAPCDAAAPGSREQLSTQHSNCGGFAGTIVSKKAKYLAGVD
jgi:hypothetical protein